MQITPLVIHAARRLPAVSPLFADMLTLSAFSVVSGGLITMTTASPMSYAVGTEITVAITDADTPNPIVDADVDIDGNVVLQTQFAHDLTTTPDINIAAPWHTTAKLSGFGTAILDGVKQLVSVPARDIFVVAPSSPVVSVALGGGEVLLERLERELIGYHRATVTSPTTLTVPTPSAISRSFTVPQVSVAINVRVFGTLAIETVLRQYTRDDGTPIPANHVMMFIAPIEVRTSRSRTSRSDAIAEISDVADVRQMLIDGFDVFVVIPTGQSASGVAAIDAAQGPILSAVLKTFYGLKMPRPEFCGGESYVATIQNHAVVAFDRANYIHRYRFQASAVLTNADAIQPFDWPDIDPNALGVDHQFPVGTGSWHDTELSPGIRHDEAPGALSGSYKMDTPQ